MMCADQGDPTITIAIQGGAAFGALVLATLLMLKFGYALRLYSCCLAP